MGLDNGGLFGGCMGCAMAVGGGFGRVFISSLSPSL